MTLTKEMSDQLKDYFPVQAHEFLNGNTYITEEAITNRLDDVDPSWEFHKLEIHRDGVTVTAVYRLTVCGVSRDGVGMASVQLSKDKDREVNEAEKSAATDALKRCARLFGIGRYILEMGRAVSDQRSLADWLAKRRGVDTKTGEVRLVQNGTKTHVEPPSSDLTPSEATNIATPAKSPQERLGTPSKQTIAPRAGKWVFDRTALLMLLSTWAKDHAYQERNNAVKAMDAEGAFTNCADIGEAVNLVMARLNSPDHGKKKEAVS